MVHVIIVIIALFVASTNLLLATESYERQKVAKDSNLYKVVQDELGLDIGSEEEVVKANFKKPKKKNYVNTAGSVVANIPEITDPINKTEKMIILGEGSTLASTAVLEKEVSKKRSGTIEYEIQEDDSLGIIAGKFGLSLSTLLWANNLNSKSYIKPGQTLKIPADSGILYTVKSGDTLDSIINKHKANKDKTLAKNKGVIDNNEHIKVGTEIILVGGQPYTPPPPKPTASSSTKSSGWGNLFTSGSSTNVTGGTLNWPSSCRRISQGVRWGHVAIDINCGYGNPIYAAESGSVSVIPNRGNGYGNYIIINHGNGLETLYGHLSSFTVQNGQYVSRGQQIGVEGSTGRSTGPHLHFEVHQGGKQNPWNYL